MLRSVTVRYVGPEPDTVTVATAEPVASSVMSAGDSVTAYAPLYVTV